MPDPAESNSPNQILSARIRKVLPAAKQDFTLDVEFTAVPGFTVLFGPSGSGKTTLLDCIAGLTVPDAGRISIGPRVLFDADRAFELPVARRNVGYVLQDLALFPHLTVEENTEYGLAHLPRSERKARAKEILQDFGIEHLGTRRPAQGCPGG